MGQAFSGVVVNQGPDGPPGNNYWQARVREPSWILRERLLSGDITGVRAILGLTGISPSVDNDSLSEGIRGLIEWTHQIDHPSMAGSMKDVDLNSMIWHDDKINSVFHYLAMGRSRVPYSETMVYYPTTGEHSSPGPEEVDSRHQRRELALELLASGRVGVPCLTALNSQGASALHIAAAVGDMEMVRLLRSHAGDMADTILYHKDNSGHAPVDVALLFGHVRSA
jgi:hypothetical protein